VEPKDQDKPSLELQLLRTQVEKLALEVEALRSSRWWDRVVGRYLPIVTALLAVAGFWFGIIQYYTQKTDTEKQRIKELRREAAKPFWGTQLALYVRASEAAATIATSDDEAVRARAEAEFWVLYWGSLSCVEDVGLEERPNPKVEAAMVEFGMYLDEHPKGTRKQENLKPLALALAHAMRGEIGPSFSLRLTPLKGERPK